MAVLVGYPKFDNLCVSNMRVDCDGKWKDETYKWLKDSDIGFFCPIGHQYKEGFHEKI